MSSSAAGWQKALQLSTTTVDLPVQAYALLGNTGMLVAAQQLQQSMNQTPSTILVCDYN